MSTPLQIAANTENAQLSTGPRTPEGKARSARNACSHGLTSRDLVIAEDDRAEFEELQTSLYAELSPEGPLETGIFQQLIHASWNLARIRRLEAELWQIEPNLLLDESASKAFDRLGRYQGRTERSYFRALRELQQLQSNRALRALLPEAEAEAAPPLAKVKLTKRTQSPAPPTAVARTLQQLREDSSVIFGSVASPRLPDPASDAV